MRNEKGQFTKGHATFANNPFKKGNKVGPRFQKGYTPWNKGKTTGPQNPKWKARISVALSGRTLSSSHRDELSRVKKGKPIPWFTTEKLPRGEKHYRWNGGSSVPLQVRGSAKYKKWRTKVFQRDGYTCTLCGKRGGPLNADHYPLLFSAILKQFSISSLEDAVACKPLWATENGRTLCVPCHKKITWPKSSKPKTTEENS